MNEQLIVKNFGPFSEEGAEVVFKKTTILIGPTGAGKSTLAKLAAVFREEIIQRTKSEKKRLEQYESVLDHYALNNYSHGNQFIHWVAPSGKLTISDTSVEVEGQWSNEASFSASELLIKVMQEQLGDFTTEISYAPEKQLLLAERVKQELGNSEEFQEFQKQLVGNPQTVYVPAERIFTAIVSTALAGLNLSGITLPRPLLEFCSFFADARSKTRNKAFKTNVFSSIEYEFINGDDKVRFPNGESLNLSEVASGLQTAIPMLLVAAYSMQKPWSLSLVVEEPELNLFPTTQSKVLNMLVMYTKSNNRDLTITTHSPYILSSCNLLLEAYKVAQLRPDLEDEIAAIVPKDCWLNPDEFAAYYVADGTVKPITDERTHLIGGNELDSVSGDISDSFRKLLRLKKQIA